MNTLLDLFDAAIDSLDERIGTRAAVVLLFVVAAVGGVILVLA